MRVLVTGGAGYIGSVVSEQLLASGHAVVVFDDFRKGHRAAVLPDAKLETGDLLDTPRVVEVLRAHRIEAVIHMAADSLVGESVQNPAKYYRNNVIGSLSLLDAMVTAAVQQIVFSSTAAVYGEPERQPISEEDPTAPTNPYGQTKLAVEQAFRWYKQAHGIRYTALRYFNAAGATERLGEDHDPETHLIPLVLGRGAEVSIFGDDYPTRDGTCIRDYIHVSDLARAHVMALDRPDSTSDIFNLGCGGEGYSVKEVIDAARRITGREIRTRIAPRRAGDPAVLVAASKRITSELGWRPERTLDDMIESAWRWMRVHPHGYAATPAILAP